MVRPLKFETAEELSERISEYFYSCDTNMKVMFTKEGDPIEVPDPKPYTISGLAYFLGTNRQTLLNYEEREEFVDTIRAAKARIEAFVEESLWVPKIAQGVVFNLKNNFGWKEQQDINMSGELEINVSLDDD
ncbi:DNA-packaging protein [Cytobacillus oceanisediminis]|uniref:DNA-packaging protein n=1 Tax=Cytobacillus oceanisediminis TaxID=665099 RepID=UPI001C247C3E|nr:DNA-packaging protein [Cytobacillus oceanisediminis]MBU8770325.1 DNA-packaging protein [Cytobacillus oceanisediminis]